MWVLATKITNILLAHGQTQGSKCQNTNKSLTTGPFGNTYEADVVSLEVAIGDCRTHESAIRREARKI